MVCQSRFRTSEVDEAAAEGLVGSGEGIVYLFTELSVKAIPAVSVPLRRCSNLELAHPNKLCFFLAS